MAGSVLDWRIEGVSHCQIYNHGSVLGSVAGKPDHLPGDPAQLPDCSHFTELRQHSCRLDHRQVPEQG